MLIVIAMLLMWACVISFIQLYCYPTIHVKGVDEYELRMVQVRKQRENGVR